MIKLATVFSGIGAIEHALDRMGLDHKIVFACDNGDIDILSKEIDEDLIVISNEINSLNEIIKNTTNGDKAEENELNEKLKDCEDRLADLTKILSNCEFDIKSIIKSIENFVEDNVVNAKNVSKSKIKKIIELLENAKSSTNENQKYKIIQISLLNKFLLPSLSLLLL